jgi:hypothetical protein
MSHIIQILHTTLKHYTLLQLIARVAEQARFEMTATALSGFNTVEFLIPNAIPACASAVTD